MKKLTFFLLLSFNSYAEDNCFISVFSRLHDGQLVRDEYSFEFKTEKECTQLKKVYETNTAPQTIEKRWVSAEFKVKVKK